MNKFKVEVSEELYQRIANEALRSNRDPEQVLSLALTWFETLVRWKAAGLAPCVTKDGVHMEVKL